MKYLFTVCAVFALLAVGCGEGQVVDSRQPGAGPAAEVMEVDKIALESVLASNQLTLVDFTATW